MSRRPVGLENLFGPPKQKSKAEELAMKRDANKLWHRPPQIVPNYGNTKKNIIPKSNFSRVFLHDNNSQQMLLDAKSQHIEFEREKSLNLFDLHKKTFLVEQSLKQHQLRASGITHLSFLPNAVANGYCQFYANSLGLKMDVLDQSSKERKRQKLEKMKERAHFVCKSAPESRTQSRQKSAGQLSLMSDSQPLLEEEGKREGQGSAGNKGSNRATPHLPNLGSAKQKPVNGTTRVSQSAFPGETRENRPNSRAFLTHDYQLRRGHTFTNPRYSAKRRNHGNRSNEPRSDPRFILLHRSLIPNDKDLGGFVSLSPSGAAVLQKYGSLLSSSSDLT